MKKLKQPSDSRNSAFSQGESGMSPDGSGPNRGRGLESGSGALAVPGGSAHDCNRRYAPVGRLGDVHPTAD